MNTPPPPTSLPSGSPRPNQRRQALTLDVSDQFACFYDSELRTLWSGWRPRGVPNFSLELLRDMEVASRTIESQFAGRNEKDGLKHLVVRSLRKNVFSLGGDLAYFAKLIQTGDRAGLTEYARAAIEVQYRNFTGHGIAGVTTIALLEGDALGGGLECALSCDVVIAERHVRAGFPEVMFNMFPGMGGLSFVSRRASRAIADQMSRTGRLYTAQELLDLGLVDQVVDTGAGASAVSQFIRQRAVRRTAHDALNRVDRLIRPISLQELYDVTKIWVECALELDDRSIAWMRRLYQRQLQLFGDKPTLVSVGGDKGQVMAA